MTETTTVARSARPHVAALVAGAVMLVAVGATAGWMVRGADPVAEVAKPDLTAQFAPTAAGASKLVADDEVAPPPKSPPAPEREAAPAPARKVARPAPAPAAGESRRAAVCQNCGVVEGITQREVKGEANGLGAVAGGVIGGALGNQVGGGNGRKAMTVIGVVGGGLAGHEIEKRARGETVYDVRVRLDGGGTRTVTVKQAPAPGSRVVVEGQSLRVTS